MKTLYIVRHAKSSWDVPGLHDDQRPLLTKGIQRTGKVIRFLQQKDVQLDLVISSHAVRALETARLIAGGLDYPEGNITVDQRIYHGGAGRIYELLYELPSDIDAVMVVGHNPAFTDLVNDFLDPMIDNLPTSGLVSVSFDADRWQELPLSDWKVNFYIYPKAL